MTSRLAVLVVLAACATGGPSTSGGKPTMFDVEWTRPGDAPAGAGALRHAILTPAWFAIERDVIDPATGAVRWSATEALVGADGDAIVLVRREGDRYTAIERREAKTGAMIGEAALGNADGTPRKLVPGGALVVASGRVVYAYLGRAWAFAIDGGREVWSATVDGDRSVAVVSGAQVGLVGDATLLVVDAADGREVWRAALDGIDTDVVASPRGGFFVPRGERVVELSAAGAEVRGVAGRFAAAHGEWLAARHGADVVVVDGRGREVDRVTPSGAGDYLAAPGLCDGALVYFRNRDATVWWRAADGSGERAVAVIPAKARDVGGERKTAGATLTEPPRCAGDHLLIQDWTVTAYRLPRVAR